IRYDPYQLIAVAQQLVVEGLPMVEVPQTVPNLTEASANLFDCIKSATLRVYRDAGLRQAVARCVAVETPRGWRIAKEKASHRIDVIVALAQAALGAVRDGAGAAWWARDPGPDERIAANVRAEPRARALNDSEMAWMRRIS